jgi:FkbM family methyltransferase
MISSVGRIRAVMVDNTRRAVRSVVAHRSSRAVLNNIYAVLSSSQREWFHRKFAKIFRAYTGDFEEGEWSVSFCGKPIIFPLAAESAWLHWDAAVSAIGHDLEIKRTYEELLRLNAPPRLFLDVGANYGTHSILFLIHKVRTVSFEPNPRCHTFFRDLCARNHVVPEIEAMALSDHAGRADLWFPESEEWLGTIRSQVKDTFESDTPLSRLEVSLSTLDSYTRNHSLQPHLIKIDTEGNELRVLQGSSQTLSTIRPLVILEVWQRTERQQLLQCLVALQYQICALPVGISSTPAALSADQFGRSTATNFIAIPQEVLAGWPPMFD